MRLLLVVTWFLVSAGLPGCSRAPQSDHFPGEWAAINTPLYLNIHGDSLSFIGHVPPTDWSDYRANPSPQGPNGWTGPFFQPPSSPFGFTVGKYQELVIHLYHNVLDTLGRVTEDRDTLVLQREHPGDQIRMVRLHADSAIHLTKIQFSSRGCPAGCPAYDLELRNGSLIFAEPAGVQEGQDQGSVRYFVGAFSPQAFKRCEEIVQKANLNERRSRFEQLVRSWNRHPNILSHSGFQRYFIFRSGRFTPVSFRVVTAHSVSGISERPGCPDSKGHHGPLSEQDSVGMEGGFRMKIDALRAIKMLHTLIWAFFASCIVAIPIVAWARRFDVAIVLIAVVFVEVLVIAFNSLACPLTAVAGRYTEDRRDNFWSRHTSGVACPVQQNGLRRTVCRRVDFYSGTLVRLDWIRKRGAKQAASDRCCCVVEVFRTPPLPLPRSPLLNADACVSGCAVARGRAQA